MSKASSNQTEEKVNEALLRALHGCVFDFTFRGSFGTEVKKVLAPNLTEARKRAYYYAKLKKLHYISVLPAFVYLPPVLNEGENNEQVHEDSNAGS